AVAVVFAVRLVVLLVVGDEIPQREPVVHGDDVDGCARTPPLGTIAVDVRRSTQPRRKFRKAPVLAAPPVAEGVAESSVPLAPLRGKPADLVAVHLADVPRF